MKRVLYIGGLESAQRGAVGTHTSGVISGFQSNGIEVTGVFLSGCEPHNRPNKTIIVKSSNIPGKIGRIINRIRIIFAVLLIKEKYDIVYHRYDPILSPFIAKIVDILEYNDDTVSQVLFAQKRGEYNFIGGLLRKIIYPYLFALSERFCFGRSGRVVCVTEGLCDVVRMRNPKSRTVLMPNASLAVYKKKEEDNRGQQLRIAHVGTLTHWDGILELIEAIKIFIRKYPEKLIKFDIVGSGSLKEQIRKKIIEDKLGKYIFMHEPVSHDEAIDLLHNVDVVPLLKTISDYGLSPIKFYEALCLGRFLICTDIRHISEISTDEGIIVPYPINIEKIVMALVFIHENISIIREREENRSCVAVRKHSWNARIGSLLEEIERDESLKIDEMCGPHHHRS